MYLSYSIKQILFHHICTFIEMFVNVIFELTFNRSIMATKITQRKLCLYTQQILYVPIEYIILCTFTHAPLYIFLFDEYM